METHPEMLPRARWLLSTFGTYASQLVQGVAPHAAGGLGEEGAQPSGAPRHAQRIPGR